MYRGEQEDKILPVDNGAKQRKRCRSTLNKETSVNFETIFENVDVGVSQNFQISFQPILRANLFISRNFGNCKPPKELGCILYSSKQEISDVDIARAIHSKIAEYLGRNAASRREKRLIIYKFMCLQGDNLEDVIDSVSIAREDGNMHDLLGSDEIQWWNSAPSTYYRVITRFRRLSKCLCIVSEKTNFVRRSKLSLMDILLHPSDIQEFV
jgi:hypothetical protein